MIGLVCNFYVELLTHIEVFKLPVVVDAGCERLLLPSLITLLWAGSAADILSCHSEEKTQVDL